jgi:hypothetical protein
LRKPRVSKNRVYKNIRSEQAKPNPRKKKKKCIVGKENEEEEKRARKEFLVESKVIYK